MLRRFLAIPLSAAAIVSLAAALVLLLGTGSAAAASGNIRVNPATQTVAAANTNFTVTLTQNADVVTTGAQASVTFDKAILQIQSFALGAAYTGGSLTSGNTVANANSTGTLQFAAAFLAPPGSVPTGDQAFLVITFQGLKCGKSPITLSTLEMTDSAGGSVPVTGTNGNAIITSAVDFNPPGGDGIQDWTTPVGDTDCDGFTTTAENFMGTDANLRCAANTGVNNEPPPDGFPFDFDDNQAATITDVTKFGPVFNTTLAGNPGVYSPRFDYNQSNSITITDVTRFGPVFNKRCA